MKILYLICNFALQVLSVIGFLIFLPIAAVSSWICSRLEAKFHELQEQGKEML